MQEYHSFIYATIIVVTTTLTYFYLPVFKIEGEEGRKTPHQYIRYQFLDTGKNMPKTPSPSISSSSSSPRNLSPEDGGTERSETTRALSESLLARVQQAQIEKAVQNSIDANVEPNLVNRVFHKVFHNLPSLCRHPTRVVEAPNVPPSEPFIEQNVETMNSNFTQNNNNNQNQIILTPRSPHTESPNTENLPHTENSVNFPETIPEITERVEIIEIPNPETFPNLENPISAPLEVPLGADPQPVPPREGARRAIGSQEELHFSTASFSEQTVPGATRDTPDSPKPHTPLEIPRLVGVRAKPNQETDHFSTTSTSQVISPYVPPEAKKAVPNQGMDSFSTTSTSQKLLKRDPTPKEVKKTPIASQNPSPTKGDPKISNRNPDPHLEKGKGKGKVDPTISNRNPDPREGPLEGKPVKEFNQVIDEGLTGDVNLQMFSRNMKIYDLMTHKAKIQINNIESSKTSKKNPITDHNTYIREKLELIEKIINKIDEVKPKLNPTSIRHYYKEDDASVQARFQLNKAYERSIREYFAKESQRVQKNSNTNLEKGTGDPIISNPNSDPEMDYKVADFLLYGPRHVIKKASQTTISTKVKINNEHYLEYVKKMELAINIKKMLENGEIDEKKISTAKTMYNQSIEGANMHFSNIDPEILDTGSLLRYMEFRKIHETFQPYDLKRNQFYSAYEAFENPILDQIHPKIEDFLEWLTEDEKVVPFLLYSLFASGMILLWKKWKNRKNFKN